ncbi:hypothetical protein Poli38472_002361 [Pythium oligandrum]|uniref:Uncharacterized protein n=1 Tax=Pythium oligandrum TaxID=41045 RepID=A0A8K1FH23_PYTOL|nr:hypothetical protein Poli38472_002361 [Pythium oligandrum]|eukprot:TMW63420.1 hypothetical protein Poli38472_002361 [Pythium oligandrum]
MRGLLALLVVLAALALSAQYTVADVVHEETVDASGAAGEPKLTEEAFAKIFEKLSTKCQKEIEANPTDPSQLSERCRAEFGRKIQRYMERQKEGDKPEKKAKKQKQEKPKKEKKAKKKSRKPSRAAQEAAAAAKKEEEYQQTVMTIVGFIGTLIAVVIGAMCVINRKLKAAGMYYPADPAEPANCCG